MLADLSHEEILRYSRHLLIPEVGIEGQRKLKAASVLIVGTGGLGSPAALYLAAAGVGHIGLVDFDMVDRSNLQRQVIHGSSFVGKPKVESARSRLLDLNPDIRVDIYNYIFSSENAREIAELYHLIIDASDNFPTRYLVNDLCVLTGKADVYGSVYRFDGQVSVFDARLGPCYRCLFPESPPPGLVPSCDESGVFGVVPGTIGMLQATEALKLILGVGEPLIGRLLLYNAEDVSFEFVRLHKNPACKVCGGQPAVTGLIDYQAFCGIPSDDGEHGSAGEAWDITPGELAARIKSGEHLTLVDVREPHELDISHIDGARNIPLGQLAMHSTELNPGDDIVLLCKTGVRSTRALHILLGAGFQKLYNLKGGMNGWAREIDPSQPVY
jgi:molybdopterin/thiamine biosynthesis adenylyltransferase/rhodanese-related sulfurtransferase